MKRILLIALAVALAVTAMAQEGEMSPEMQEAMMKMMTPNEHHARMAKLAGEYTFTAKSWMAPGAPEEDFSGTRSAKMIMGGRFLEETSQSSFNGMPFEGRGIMGYDNGMQKHTFIWLDNMGTGTITAMGGCDKSGIEFTGEHFNPMTGGMNKFRNVYRIINDDSFVFEWHEAGPDGKEFKMMEITYTRKK